MTIEIKEYAIKCNKCDSYLEYPQDSSLIAYRGHFIKEDTRINIEIVAKQFNWNIDNNNHLCPNCK